MGFLVHPTYVRKRAFFRSSIADKEVCAALYGIES